VIWQPQGCGARPPGARRLYARATSRMQKACRLVSSRDRRREDARGGGQRAILLQGRDIRAAARGTMCGDAGRGRRCRLLPAQALFGRTQALLIDRADQPLDLDSLLGARVSTRYEGTLIDLASSAFPGRRLPPHADHRHQKYHLHRRLRREVWPRTQMPLRGRGRTTNSARKKISQLQDFIARFSAAPAQPGDVAQEGSREAADHRDGAFNIQRPTSSSRWNRPVGARRRRDSRASAKL